MQATNTDPVFDPAVVLADLAALAAQYESPDPVQAQTTISPLQQKMAILRRTKAANDAAAAGKPAPTDDEVRADLARFQLTVARLRQLHDDATPPDTPGIVASQLAMSSESHSVLGPGQTLLCPVCRFEYNHVDGHAFFEGNDNWEAAYDGHTGKGDLHVLQMSCESGHTWDLCVGFHKGICDIFVRNSHRRHQDDHDVEFDTGPDDDDPVTPEEHRSRLQRLLIANVDEPV